MKTKTPTFTPSKDLRKTEQQVARNKADPIAV